MKYFATGINEETFIINSGLLKPNKQCMQNKENCNKVMLEFIIMDKKTNSIITKLEDELLIYIQELDKENSISFNSDGSEVINHVMDNTFTIDTSLIKNKDSNELFYKILVEDEHNEIIPLKPLSHLYQIKFDIFSVILHQELMRHYIFQQNILEPKIKIMHII